MNDAIVYRYFLAEGDKAEAVKTEVVAEKEAHFARLGDIIKKYGADCAWGGSRSHLSALGFTHKGDGKPEMKEGFLRAKIEQSNGETYAVYYPDKRYKAGKEIVKDLQAVGIFNFSDSVTKKLGCYCDCFGTLDGRMVRAMSAAGQYGDRLVIRIPTQGDTRPRNFEIPPGLREIKKSEFIAITEENE